MARGLSLRGGKDERQTAGHHEQPDERWSDLPRWKRSIGGPGIGRIDRAIDQPVEAHGGAARPDHRHDDPADHWPVGPALGCQQHTEEGERQGEQGVLEFDHLEHGLEAFETAHSA